MNARRALRRAGAVLVLTSALMGAGGMDVAEARAADPSKKGSFDLTKKGSFDITAAARQHEPGDPSQWG
jgi:hypothetical protein